MRATITVKTCNLLLFLAGAMLGLSVGPPSLWAEAGDGSASGTEWAARLARRRAVLNVGRVPNSPAAYVEFFSGGRCDRSGADIRIFDDKGEQVPQRVMSIGPGDRFLIAYELTQSDTYFLYHDQPGSTAPRSTWRPQCGVFLRTYRRPPGTSNSVPQLETMVRSVQSLLGSGYRPSIFDGYNPYGNSDDYVSVYTGYLTIPKDGTYSFATNSDASSALYLDGKLVAAYPGIHAANARNGERQGSVALKQGIHVLSYFHAEYTGPQATTAAWKQPGEKSFTVIPPEAFVPISRSTVSAVEDKRDRLLEFSFAIDSIYAPEGEKPLIGVKFRPFSATLEKDAVYRWDFGDGERSSEESPVHVYLTENLHPVSLTVVDRRNTRQTVSHYVPVAHIEGLNTTAPEQTRDDFKKILQSYTCQRFTPDELESLHDFYAAEEGNEARVSTLAQALLTEVPGSQPERRAKFLLSWAEANEGSNQRPVHLQRARFYEEASKITRDKRMRAEALLGLGDVAFHFLNDTAAALASYRAVSNENADKELTRRALIGQGDIRLFSGELEAATDLYRRAGVLPEHDKGAEALRTSYGNLIEGYIKMGDFPAARDAISTWEWKYPLIKTEGYSFILRSRIAFAAGDMSEVRKLTTCIIETLVEDSFKPEAFYLLISSLLRQRQVVLAKDFYQILVDRFPRDAYVEMLRSSFR